MLALAGAGAGAGALFSGYFDLSVWGWIALVTLGALCGLALARPARPTGPALVAVCALAALAIWSLISIGWAESADSALIEGDRWIAYAAFFALLLVLLRGPDRAQLLVWSFAGAALLATIVLVFQLLGSGSDRFLGDRLSEPVGYVNGEAAYLLVPIWPLLTAAERSRSAWVAGLAAAAASVCAGLIILTQSRGAIAAFVLSALVLLLVVPGRDRRALLLAGLAAVTALLAAGPLSDLSPAASIEPTDAEVRGAVAVLLLASAGFGALWSLLALGMERWGDRVSARAKATVATATAAVVLAALALAGFPGVSTLPDRVGDQYSSFTELQPVESEDRLLSGGGNRYDYWRVAWVQFSDDPLKGVGAGNYDTTYFVERENDEAIRQPHSIEMQALGETGLPGFIALAALVAAAFWALFVRSRPGRPEYDPAIALSAGGAFLVWLGQSSVDWTHLIPGMAAVALCALAALLQPWLRPASAARGSRWVWLAGSAVVLVVASVLIARPVLALHQRSEGFRVVERDPRAALEHAQKAIDLNSQSVETHYLAASAYARLGSYPQAKGALLDAVELEPSNHVPWVLLGDLESRRGDREAAVRSYRRASALNPRDEAIKELAERPPL
ncbi:MAG: O-antigen ligase family protein [Solirubrobacterales bacterium]